MKPANTALSPVDLGTPALRWPDMQRTTISLASPDEGGAVAYYFDTLCRSGMVDNIELAGETGRAACRYLLGLVQSKGLELVRGPFLTMAPDHGPTPEGWWMIRALVWVEEFDLVVPTQPAGDSGLRSVLINGDTVLVDPRPGDYLTYADVVQRAGFDLGQQPTVTFDCGDGPPDGILSDGQRVRIRQEGTEFHVTTLAVD